MGEMILYETAFRYDRWVKFFLGLPFVLTVGVGLILSGWVQIDGLMPEGIDGETQFAGFLMFGMAGLLLFMYWLMLPVKVIVHMDRLRIKIGRFFWTIPFETVESLRAAKGFPGPGTQNAMTSFKSQVEIVRRKGRRVRISPENRDEFLDHANRALEDWRRLGDGRGYFR